MREAFPGQFGNNADNAHMTAGAGGDPSRMSNLHRAIDSIEQRINSQAGANGSGFGSGANSSHNLGMMQQKLNQLSSQVGLTPSMTAPSASGGRIPEFDAATADIMRRQHALNGGEALAQQAAVDAISGQFNELKAELGALRKEVAKPITVQSKVSKGEIQRIAESLSGMQKAPVLDDQAFGRLTQELGQLRSTMRQDLQKEMSATKDISNRLDALVQGVDTMAAQAGNSIAPRVDNLTSQLDAMRTSIDDLPQSLSISRLEERLQEMANHIELLPTAAPEAAPTDLSSVESRLDEVARALVAVSNIGTQAPKLDLSAIDRLEARFNDMSQSIEKMGKARNNAVENEQAKALATRIEGLTDRLGSFEKYAEAGDLGGANAMFAGPDTGIIEEQLRNLTARLDEASNVNSTAAQISNLEAQIGKILRHMNNEPVAGVDLAPVEARLGQIENTMVSNQAASQQFSVEAAQLAAQQAIAMLGEHSPSGQSISALSADLKSLQTMAQSDSELNSQSIGGIHTLLNQVVDRLGSIENNIADSGARVANVLTEDDLASASGPAMPRASTLDPDPELERHAQATVKAADIVVQAGATQTGNNPGYTIQRDAAEHEAPADSFDPVHAGMIDAPSIDPVDQFAPADNAESHLPIEPGSSADDIDRMVEQASAQLNAAKASLGSDMSAGDASYGSGADNIKPDPVGAARRALQATTAEMSAVRDEMGAAAEAPVTQVERQGLLAKLGGTSLSKPVLIAAAATLLIVIGSFGYKKFMTGNGAQSAGINQPVIEQPIAKAPESDTAVAIDETTPRTVRSVDEAPSTEGEAATSVSDAVAGDAIQGDDAGPTAIATATEKPDTTIDVTPVSTEPVSFQPAASAAAPAPAFEVSNDAGPPPLVEAARSGDSKALFELGMRYSDGKSVKRDMVASAQWFERSAETGFAPAQYSIGSLYEKGIGVEKNVKTAEDWYSKAALQGNARAMHNLAVIKATGSEGEPDMDSAVRWFKDAANFGIKDSQFNLGILYGQGMGVPQNLGESYKWFALAAKTGDTDAAAKRDEVAKAMDPADLDAGRKIVADWKPAQLEVAVNKVVVPPQWRGKAAAGAPKTAKDAMKVVQTMLNDRGFNVGTPDGVAGPNTQRAIKQFQEASGLKATGRIDESFLKALGIKI